MSAECADFLKGAPSVSMRELTREEDVLPAMSGLRGGLYTMTITGPQGVILSMQVDLALRDRFSLALDDEALRELLVLNSMPQGIIEHELHERRKVLEGRAA